MGSFMNTTPRGRKSLEKSTRILCRVSGMKSVAAMGKEKGDVPLSGNEPVKPMKVVTIHSKHRIR
jgi:hypothetical protein